MDEIVVVKLNPQGQEAWRYTGRVLQRRTNEVVIEALFNRDDMFVEDVLLRRGDRLVELFFADRWFNIFELHDRDSGAIKGWYCNITRPAELGPEQIRYVDLALDLLVTPDGRQRVLDEDEFELIQPDEELRRAALKALQELKELVRPQQGFRLED
jgi:protein associated with RNAse G/E